MSDNFISIIIPTFNRVDFLVKSVENICSQDFPINEYEIIIIDDGSTDQTENAVRSLMKNVRCSIKYFRQNNKGPATARNFGLSQANGEIVLITGDGIIVTPEFLKEHYKTHQLYPEKNIAVLGYTTWSPEIKITSFMHWLESGGPQFRYYKLKPNTFTNYKYFYTSNISLKKSVLDNEKFNELFPYPAYEDIELGYRLEQKGLKIFYNPRAKAFHFHEISLKNYTKRSFQAGASRKIFNKLHPEIAQRLTRSLKSKIIYNQFSIWFWLLIGKFYETRKVKPGLFSKICEYFYLKGFYKKLS